MDTCSHCGAELPESAAFCPACGRRTDAPPAAVREVPIDVQHAEPRWFGLGPPVFVFAVATALLVLGIVLVATGEVLIGAIAIVLALCLVPSFLAGARRWPETALARAGVSAADRVRDEAEVAVDSISTWSKAGRDAVRVRRQQSRLRREREATIRELGTSVYAEDGRADGLKAAARELDRQLEQNERELARTIAGARRRVRKERAAVVATEVIAPEPPAEPEDPAKA